MPLQFFSPTEVEVLIVLTERMVGTSVPDVEHSPAVTTIDAFVAGLPLNLRMQLRRALHLFQWCPILFTGKLRPFTRLSPHDADTYIRNPLPASTKPQLTNQREDDHPRAYREAGSPRNS